MSCSVLQCVAVYCSILQCAAVCCSVVLPKESNIRLKSECVMSKQTAAEEAARISNVKKKKRAATAVRGDAKNTTGM